MFGTLRECNSAVSDLYLYYNGIDGECMKQFGEYVQDNEHLEILRLGSNKVADKGIEMISEYLIGNTKLKELEVYDIKGITDESVPYLIEIAKKSCITDFSLWDTSAFGEKKQELTELLAISIDQREIPIKSKTNKSPCVAASITGEST